MLVAVLALQTSAADREKKPEKRPTKKASSAKPTKSPKSIVEEFTGLPPEDIDFIKELDKQFNEAGGNKLKIKVQRDNSSETRSSKRTIDGELGFVVLKFNDTDSKVVDNTNFFCSILDMVITTIMKEGIIFPSRNICYIPTPSIPVT